MLPPLTRPLTRAERRRIAYLVGCDERTVDRRVRGLPTRPLVRERIDAALAELGLLAAPADETPTHDLVLAALLEPR